MGGGRGGMEGGREGGIRGRGVRGKDKVWLNS